MNKRLVLNAILATTLGLSLLPAHAGLIIEYQPPPAPQPQPEPPKPAITHTGAMPSDVTRISAKMTNQPVARVLATIVPRGWTGYVDDHRIKALKSLSFAGSNRPWPIVLEELLQEHFLVATLNWDKREVTIGIGHGFQGE